MPRLQEPLNIDRSSVLQVSDCVLVWQRTNEALALIFYPKTKFPGWCSNLGRPTHLAIVIGGSLLT